MNKLTKLHKSENNGKILFHTNMSDIDNMGYFPFEEDNQFYFTIEIDGKNEKFFQSGEYPNIFTDNCISQAHIFTPKNRNDVELHIINDYE